MIRSWPAVILLPVLLAACAPKETVRNAKFAFETSIDPGGCLVEHIAADAGMAQFHFDGLSPNGDKFAVGWRRGEDESGLYILDLKTGARTDIPDLNNGAVFSPDGPKLLNILPTDNGRTDTV